MSKDLKSNAFIDAHGLRDTVKLNDAFSFEIPADLYESTVLTGAGITMDQLKKKERLDGELMAAMTLVTGEQAADAFKTNAELSEIGFSYPMGASSTVSGVFSREGKDHTVITANTKVKTAEMKRVMDHCNSLFDNINS